MANPGDANLNLLYPAQNGTLFTLNTLPINQDFDVIADVEIGEDLNQGVDEFWLRVGVINLTTATQIAVAQVHEALIPKNNTAFRDQVRADFTALQNAANPPAVGDVLQAVASYRVRAGVTFDVSTAHSVAFVVVDAE